MDTDPEKMPFIGWDVAGDMPPSPRNFIFSIDGTTASIFPPGNQGGAIGFVSGVEVIIPAVPAALQELGLGIRPRKDFSYVSQVRLITNVRTVASAGTQLRAQYSTDGSAWAYFDGGTSPAVALDATGTPASAWIYTEGLARADVYLRLVTISGDGATNCKISTTMLEFK